MQRPATQVCGAVHCASEAHTQLVVPPSHTGRAHTPFTQVAPPMQSALLAHAPGVRVGVASVGATHTPRVVPLAPRQIQPCAQSLLFPQEAVQPRVVHTWLLGHW